MAALLQGVAPRVGAWIETDLARPNKAALLLSHPVWVRGLKPKPKAIIAYNDIVAPRVGAWIETSGRAGRLRAER